MIQIETRNLFYIFSRESQLGSTDDETINFEQDLFTLLRSQNINVIRADNDTKVTYSRCVTCDHVHSFGTNSLPPPPPPPCLTAGKGGKNYFALYSSDVDPTLGTNFACSDSPIISREHS